VVRATATREGERKSGEGGSEGYYYGAGSKETIFSVLRVPRQCPLILLVGVRIVSRINSIF
jgi:hypothetical protein